MSIKGNDNNVDEQFFNKVKHNLKVKAENLDEKVLFRLQQIRHRVLQDEKEKKKLFFPAVRWIQAGALSTLGVAITLLVIWLHSHQATVSFKNPEDFEILSSQDQMEMYEDLDFYTWLATSHSSR
jgi:hypothetical protein